MKCYISAVCALSVLVALSCAAPMPQESQASGTDTRTQTTQIVNGINNKIMLLRQYCPQLFQVIDNVIQNVTSTAFRVIGRVLLQSGGLGGGGGNGREDGGGSRVSVVLPTFGPDDDEDYDEDDEDDNTNSVSGSTSTTEASNTITTSTSSNQSSQTTITELDEDLDIRIDDGRKPTNTKTSNEVDASVNTEMPLYTSPAGEITRRKRESRPIRAAEDKAEDQDTAASGGNDQNLSEDLSNVEADDADRDKRFLPFGGSFGAHASGSTGGSGNFLFDIIRRTADGAARAAGTVYRMIAGTENLGLGLTATETSSRTLSPQLIAGSGTTEESDEKENAPVGAGGVAEIDLAKGGDGLTEGIPGPITRLFVLANRGLANLVQDLILRLAQTSERIVNFKARLITALI